MHRIISMISATIMIVVQTNMLPLTGTVGTLIVNDQQREVYLEMSVQESVFTHFMFFFYFVIENLFRSQQHWSPQCIGKGPTRTVRGMRLLVHGILVPETLGSKSNWTNRERWYFHVSDSKFDYVWIFVQFLQKSKFRESFIRVRMGRSVSDAHCRPFFFSVRSRPIFN